MNPTFETDMNSSLVSRSRIKQCVQASANCMHDIDTNTLLIQSRLEDVALSISYTAVPENVLTKEEICRDQRTFDLLVLR